MAEWTGLEPATPGVTGRYSNQLNYHSKNYLWWVLTGSNRRHSPCKGDALPAELSTRQSLLVYCILQSFASAKFWNFGCLDLDCRASTWITAIARCALAHLEGAEANETHRIAFFQCFFYAVYSRVQRTSRSCLGNVSGFCNCINQIRFIHVSPLCEWLKKQGSPCEGFISRLLDSGQAITKIIFQWLAQSESGC